MRAVKRLFTSVFLCGIAVALSILAGCSNSDSTKTNTTENTAKGSSAVIQTTTAPVMALTDSTNTFSSTTEKSVTVTSAANHSSNPDALLQEYFDNHYKSEDGKLIYDFDGDNTKEMIVIYVSEKKDDSSDLFYNMKLYSVSNGSVCQTDSFQGSVFKKSYANRINGYKVISKDKIYIALEGICVFDGDSARYTVFSLSNGKLENLLDLYDPGFSGATALYYYDEYKTGEDPYPGTLYYEGGDDPSYGKYKDYKTALQTELAKYGLKIEPFNSFTELDACDDYKCQIAVADPVTRIFNYEVINNY